MHFTMMLPWVVSFVYLVLISQFPSVKMRKESRMDTEAKPSEVSAQSSCFEKRIVIIGAGVSGLSAASQLEKLGFKNVLLLEATDHIHGRVQTMYFGKNFIELGAEWIHGQGRNPLYEIANEHGFVEEVCPSYLESLYTWDHVKKKEDREAISNTYNFLQEVTDKIEDSVSETTELPKSFDIYLSNHFEKYLKESQDTDHIKQVKRACYDWFIKLQLELNGCNRLSDLSCKLLSNYEDFPGCQFNEMKYGYSALLNFIFRNVPKDWIRKNRKVKTIVWNKKPNTSELGDKMGKLQLSNCENRAINVHCENGEKYSADHVIITIPLGSLKESFNSLFVPPLPSSKVKAIESLGFGTINKIYLEFEKPFWDKQGVYNMLWFNESFRYLIESDSFQKHPQDSWYKYISRFMYVSHNPKMLCAWIVGDGAVFMESLPVDQVKMKCHRLLQQQLGRSDIPMPSRIIRSQWTSNPFSRGSYSYLSVACEEANITNKDLEIPILGETDSRPLLLFAGEATNSIHYSTVHGAYETGIREAYRIFDYYRLSPVPCVMEKKTG